MEALAASSCMSLQRAESSGNGGHETPLCQNHVTRKNQGKEEEKRVGGARSPRERMSSSATAFSALYVYRITMSSSFFVYLACPPCSCPLLFLA